MGGVLIPLEVTTQDLKTLVSIARSVTEKTGITKYYISASTRRAFENVLKDLGDDTLQQYFKFVHQPVDPPAPEVAKPTAPVLGAPSVASSQISIPITTPSTHNDGVSGYEVWMGSTPGTEVYIGTTAVFTYVTPALPAGNYYFKFKGIAVSNPLNVSDFSNEVSATIAGALGADTHGPTASAQPSIESGGGATLASVAVVTPPPDDTSYSGSQVVSGGDKVLWWTSPDDNTWTQDSSKDSFYPELSTASIQDIGAFKSGTGTDNGSTIVGVSVTGGNEALYGTVDGGFTFNCGGTKGKVTLFIKVTGATAPITNAGYEKPIGLMVRATNDANSAYFNVFLFNSAGASAIGCEFRDTAGTAANQVAATAYSGTRWLKLVYDPDTSYATSSWSSNSTNGTDGSWTVIATRSIPAIGKNYLSGKFSCNGGTGTYTNYSRTVDTQVRYPFTGTQQIGSVTNVYVAHSALDKAGNGNARGPSRQFTFDALPSGGGGGGGTESRLAFYGIGGFNRYGQDVVPFLKLMHRAVATLDVGSGSISYAATEANVKAYNSDFALIPYSDNTRLDSPGLSARAVAADFILRNGDGSIAYFGGSGGDNYGVTYTLNYGYASTDWSPAKRDANGRTVSQLVAAYMLDRNRKGGANGLATEGFPSNSNNRGYYDDDFLTNPPFPGLFTPGNVNAAYWMVKGVVDEADYARSLYAADGEANPIIGCNASKWYQNADAVMSTIMPIAAGKFDLPLYEHIGSVLGGQWAGPGNVIDRLNNNVFPLVRTGGYGVWDCDIDPPGYSDRPRQLRFTSGACFVLSNHLWAPKVNPEQYYRAYYDTFVYAKFFDVNTSTGVGKDLASASKAFAWLGAAVDSPRTSAGTNGLYVREFANAYVVVNPPDTSGARSWTAPRNVKRIQCDDDATMDGATFAGGATINIPAVDAQYFLKV